jgi:glycosyltransferase involved in cell wall biosynthesis
MTRIDVGLIAPLPPQIGGVASFAGWLLAHERDIGCRYAAFDLWRPPGEEAGGRLDRAAVVRQLRLGGRFMRWVPSCPRLVHFCAAFTWTGLARDLLYLLLLRASGKTTLVHIQVVGDASSRLWRLVNRMVSSLSVERVVISFWSQAELARMGVSSRCIFNPISLSPRARTHSQESDSPSVLFVGTYGRRKGCPELIDALAEVRKSGVDLTLTLVGHEEHRGEEEMLRRQIGERALDGAVEFAGVASPAELERQYARADIFCLPSRVEGLPMALLEAMAFALPVIVTPVGGIPDVVEDGTSGVFVQPGDAEGLASALRSLVLSQGTRERIGAAAQARAQALAAPEKVVAAWQQLYSEYAGVTHRKGAD